MYNIQKMFDFVSSQKMLCMSCTCSFILSTTYCYKFDALYQINFLSNFICMNCDFETSKTLIYNIIINFKYCNLIFLIMMLQN